MASRSRCCRPAVLTSWLLGRASWAFRACCKAEADKASAFAALLVDAGIAGEDSGFMGDDLPDLPPMRVAGFAVTVVDGCNAAKAAAHWISPHPGGRGAVRALAEFILHAKGIDVDSMVHG